MNYTNEQILNMNFSESIEKQASQIADEIIQEENFEKIASFYCDYGVARAEADIAKLAFARFEKTASAEEQEEKEEEEEKEKEKDLSESDKETVKEASLYADFILDGYFDRLANRGESDFNNPGHYFDLLAKHAGVGGGALQNIYFNSKNGLKEKFKNRLRSIKNKAYDAKNFVKQQEIKAVKKIENTIGNYYTNKNNGTKWDPVDKARYENRNQIAKGILYGGGAGLAATGAGAIALSRLRKNDKNQ